MTSENINIYELGLHESTFIVCPSTPRIMVTRVAGGWIYNFQNSTESTFVPYHNEFQKG